MFATGLISPLYQGVRSAVLPQVLPPGPRYVLGRALMRMMAQSAQIVGYGVGGLLLAVLSPRGALAADALSFAASGLVLRFGISARPAPATRRGSMARDSLAGLREVLAHPQTRRILLFSWLVAACVVAPEALAAPYAAHIGQPARAVGFLLTGIPLGTVAADIIAARLLPSRAQRRIIVPAALLSFAPMAAFAASPGLVLAVGLLVVAGLGNAWTTGMDGLLIDTAPLALRNRALALAGAGMMFTQGAGFALWGIAGQYIPPAAAICSGRGRGRTRGHHPAPTAATQVSAGRRPARAAQRPPGTAISPSRDQSSCGTTMLTIFGVRTRKGGRVRWAFLKCSDWTCALPASPSRNASTSTYSAGSARLLDQSNHRQPGSARVASVNSAEISGQASACSGSIWNLAVMKIIGLLCGTARPHRRAGPAGHARGSASQ